jgi:hypothetical protein
MCIAGSATAEKIHSRILVGLGRLAEASDEAASRHQQALAVALGHRYFPAAASAVESLAGAALIEDDGERAALLLSRA